MKFAPMNYHYLRYPIKKFLDKVERSPFNSIDLYCSAPQLNLFDYPLSRLIELKKEIEAHHLSVMAMTPENCVYPVNFCTQDDLTNGLAEGSYWLVETQAPDGYNKLTAPVKITITKSDTTNVDDWTIKQNDGVVDDKIIDIENTTGTLLPETGGMGTVIFTVIAVVMILGIAVSFVISRRKRA